MHVFFDEQTFMGQEQGGISRYFTELAQALGACGIPCHVFGGITRNAYLPSLRRAANVTVRSSLRRDHLRINKALAHLSRFWRRWDFAQVRRRGSPIIYHSTHYDVDPWIARRADATCLTVFDMIAEVLCDELTRKRSLALKRRGLALADLAICISSHTEQDLLAHVPEVTGRTAVILLAASLPAPRPEDLQPASKPGTYLLFVGNRGGYKNGLRALEAFSHLARRHAAVKLVCFGGEPLNFEEQLLLAENGVQDRVLTERGDDYRLAAFYSEAAALIYPSRYEGFGLPVLEAMSFGCPVITTRCASLPEVGGEAAVYVEPDDTPGFVKAMEHLLTDVPARGSWGRAGRTRAEAFSWKITAAQTRTAYERALAGRQTGTGTVRRK